MLTQKEISSLIEMQDLLRNDIRLLQSRFDRDMPHKDFVKDCEQIHNWKEEIEDIQWQIDHNEPVPTVESRWRGDVSVYFSPNPR